MVVLIFKRTECRSVVNSQVEEITKGPDKDKKTLQYLARLRANDESLKGFVFGISRYAFCFKCCQKCVP